jgi:uncharacterized protein YjiS (DUF1127 family)
MSDCTDTMPSRGLGSGPLEGFATWLSAGILRGARFGDRLAVVGLTSVLAWRERTRQRKALAGLNDRMRRDIGLSAADIHRESNKPFWLA